MEIGQSQLKLARAMQGNVNPADCRRGVSTSDSKEGIKRCRRVRIQQRFAQTLRAYYAISDGIFLIPGITEPRLPIPILEVIAKLSHLTAKAYIEQRVREGGLGCRPTRVSNAAEMNSSGDGRAIGQNRIRTRERVKRILDWHTDTVRTKGSTVCLLEWIRRKPNRRPGSIK